MLICIFRSLLGISSMPYLHCCNHILPALCDVQLHICNVNFAKTAYNGRKDYIHYQHRAALPFFAPLASCLQRTFSTRILLNMLPFFITKLNHCYISSSVISSTLQNGHVAKKRFFQRCKREMNFTQEKKKTKHPKYYMKLLPFPCFCLSRPLNK